MCTRKEKTILRQRNDNTTLKLFLETNWKFNCAMALKKGNKMINA